MNQQSLTFSFCRTISIFHYSHWRHGISKSNLFLSINLFIKFMENTEIMELSRKGDLQLRLLEIFYIIFIIFIHDNICLFPGQMKTHWNNTRATATSHGGRRNDELLFIAPTTSLSWMNWDEAVVLEVPGMKFLAQLQHIRFFHVVPC